MLGKFMCVKVALSNTSYSYDMEYTYAVSKEMESEAKQGCRILVPFGKGNRRRIGLVTRIYFKDNYDPALKPVLEFIDKEPSLNEEMLKMVFWLKENTFCTYFEAFKTVIPTGLNVKFNTAYEIVKGADESKLTPEETGFFEALKSSKNKEVYQSYFDFEKNPSAKKITDSLVVKGCLAENNEFKRKVGDETVRMVRLSQDYENGRISFNYTAKQHSVIEMLEECGCGSVKELCYLCAITPAVINTLVKKQVLETYDYEVLRSPLKKLDNYDTPDSIKLSLNQTQAFVGIKELVDKNKPAGALLYGVTGSGKTSVFVKLIDYVLKLGKTAIMLVPEISLTPQMVGRFQKLFGETVAVIHSSLSVGQRVDEYKRIKTGKAKIVIGTRSAVFAPLDNLGIIIMDEEGERTYKSESTPRYHARDVAINRCGYHNCVLLMASATPSVESYYYAEKKRFSYFELNERYNKSELPQVVIVDMQLEADAGNRGTFSKELINQMNINLKNKQQTILLLNRRGYYTYITCLDCKKPVVCPNCNIPLTYHKANGQLMCHYCGYERPMDSKCPECGSTHLHPTGLGTQKLEDEISQLFPQARVLRMDADTTYSKYSYEKNFKDFSDGKYDIMIGTQMIAKGLDFPDVTLVGVLNLDKSLFSGGFKSYERTFSLITQVVGRSGRGEKNGMAFIQTYVPDHYVLNLAAKQDYKGFYEEEIALRKVLVYPPFCDICVIGLSSMFEKSVKKASDEFVMIMDRKINELKLDIPLRVLGPSKCDIEKINNKYRYRIIIKCKNSHTFRQFISDVLKEALKSKLFSNTSLYADINGDLV